MKFKTSLLAVLSFAATHTLAIGAVITVTTVDNDSSPGDDQISLREAITSLADGDTIAFNIAGTGPHLIETPLGGYPFITANDVTIDGYTQPGAVPNTNPILGGNNAQLQIVLDSTDNATAPGDPADPNLNSRRSSRILHDGYGDSENGILVVLAVDNFTVRGLSFIGRPTDGSTADPAIYAVALVNAVTNARVQGCWFGLAPGGSNQADIKPVTSAVAAFRYRVGGDVFSEGAIVGTDGDGTNDRAEFNVMLGCHIAMALELPRARVSGNYVNVFPDGNTFVDVDEIHQRFIATGRAPDDSSIENFENGRVTDDTVIGINGDGVSDSDERNIFAHAIYNHDLEVYSSAVRVVVAGNYFGVGADGTTLAPVPTSEGWEYDWMEFPGTGSLRIGSNGDGVSDELEGNLVYGVKGDGAVLAGASVPIVARGNVMSGNHFQGVPFSESQNGSFIDYYAAVVAHSSKAVPVVEAIKDQHLRGSFSAPAGEYVASVIEVYRLDPSGLDSREHWPLPLVHPRSLIGSFVDNAPEDLNPAPNEFEIDLTAAALGTNELIAVAVSYSKDAGKFEVERAVTSPLSSPTSTRPRLRVARAGTDEIGNALLEFSWLAPENEYLLQVNTEFDSNWFDIGVASLYSRGNNTYVYAVDQFTVEQFFRVITVP